MHTSHHMFCTIVTKQLTSIWLAPWTRWNQWNRFKWICNSQIKILNNERSKHLRPILCSILALAVKADKKSTKSLKFKPSAILSSLYKDPTNSCFQHNINSNSTFKSPSINTNSSQNITWDRGFMANSGTDKNSSSEINPFAFRSNWQNLWYNDTISCWETEFVTHINK